MKFAVPRLEKCYFIVRFNVYVYIHDPVFVSYKAGLNELLKSVSSNQISFSPY